jgi:hypothetical protein
LLDSQDIGRAGQSKKSCPVTVSAPKVMHTEGNGEWFLHLCRKKFLSPFTSQFFVVYTSFKNVDIYEINPQDLTYRQNEVWSENNFNFCVDCKHKLIENALEELTTSLDLLKATFDEFIRKLKTESDSHEKMLADSKVSFEE